MSEKNYITKKGLLKLTSEYEHLIKVERPEVTRVVAWAASLGDRSENADYQYGKKRLREIDKRLAFLSGRIEAAHVVEYFQMKGEKIQFGATVTIQNEDGEVKTYTIVGVDETDQTLSYISWKSPIGSALLGKVTGDTIIVNSPKGKAEYEIISVSYLLKE